MPGRRITVSEETYRALQAEGLVRGKSPGGVLAELVEEGISQTAKKVLGTVSQKATKTKKPETPNNQKIPLREDEKAQQKIRDLWEGGERNRTEIARKVDRPPRTIQIWIREEIEKGELSTE